jgi:diphthamide biosynthesis methyltransferase
VTPTFHINGFFLVSGSGESLTPSLLSIRHASLHTSSLTPIRHASHILPPEHPASSLIEMQREREREREHGENVLARPAAQAWFHAIVRCSEIVSSDGRDMKVGGILRCIFPWGDHDRGGHVTIT